jgi:hypothetical protein
MLMAKRERAASSVVGPAFLHAAIVVEASTDSIYTANRKAGSFGKGVH